MKTVYCPVRGEQVDGITCLEICLVADDMMKERTLPEGTEWDLEQRQKCLACKWHGDLEDS